MNTYHCSPCNCKQPYVQACSMLAQLLLIACWLERWTCDRKVVSWNPGRSCRRIFCRRIFVSRVNFWCLFDPRVTAVAPKRPQSLCQKCWWQVTPKHEYTLDPMKLEWAVQAWCGNLSRNKLTCNSSGNTRPVISAC